MKQAALGVALLVASLRGAEASQEGLLVGRKKGMMGGLMNMVKGALGLGTGRPGEVRESPADTATRLMMKRVKGDWLTDQEPFKWRSGKAYDSRDAPEWPNTDSPGNVVDGTGTYKFDRSGVFLLSELGQRVNEGGPPALTAMGTPPDSMTGKEPETSPSFSDPELQPPSNNKYEGRTPLPGIALGNPPHAPLTPRPGPQGVQHNDWPPTLFDVDAPEPDPLARTGPQPVEEMGPKPVLGSSDLPMVNDAFKLPPHTRVEDAFLDPKAPPE